MWKRRIYRIFPPVPRRIWILGIVGVQYPIAEGEAIADILYD